LCLVEKGKEIVQIPKHLIPATVSVNNAVPKSIKAKNSADYATEIDRLRQELESIKKAAEDNKSKTISPTKVIGENKRKPMAPSPIIFKTKRKKDVDFK
jgi:hypothetical protein